MFRNVLLGSVRFRKGTFFACLIDRQATLRKITKRDLTSRNFTIQPYATSNLGFTLVEVLASLGILITFLTASLVAFTSTQRLSEDIQQSSVALQGAKGELEKMRAGDFRSIETNYGDGGSGTGTGFLISSDFDGMGHIVLRDVYDDGIYGDGYDDWTQAAVPPWGVRRAYGAFAFNNRLWVIGGYNGSRLQDVWFSEDGENWTQVDTSASPTMWSPRGHHTALAFDNRLWVICGNSDAELENDAWSSADGGATWTEETSAATSRARRAHTSVVFDNKIWLLGGRDNSGNYFNDVWSSSDGQSWTEVKPNDVNGWSARYDHTSVVFDNRIWVLGGQDPGGSFNDVWSSVDGQAWVQEKPDDTNGWSKRNGHTTIVFDGRLWVIGGLASGAVNDVWYSFDGSSWTEASSSILSTIPWAARNWHQSVAYGGRLWVLGGYSGSYLNDVWWSYGAERMYEVDITVSWRQQNSRIIGEDNGAGGGTALDGQINGTEDVNGNGILDSPVHLTAILTNRGYPAQVYMGRE